MNSNLRKSSGKKNSDKKAKKEKKEKTDKKEKKRDKVVVPGVAAPLSP